MLYYTYQEGVRRLYNMVYSMVYSMLYIQAKAI